MNFEIIDDTTLDNTSGGFDLVTVFVAFAIGYALKEYTEGYFNPGKVEYYN